MIDLKALAPEEAEPLERIAAKLLARDKQLFDEAAAADVPVKHTIKIEPLN